MGEEIWKDILGYIGFYQVSNHGNVRSMNRCGRMTTINLKPTLTTNGYIKVGLCKNNITKNHLVHRLVAIAFLMNNDEKESVNHKNGIKTDNRVENLEWCTHSENINHAILNKLDNTCTPVTQYDLNGNKLKEFISITEAAKSTGANADGIRLSMNDSKCKKTSGGYRWQKTYPNKAKRISRRKIPKIPVPHKNCNRCNNKIESTKRNTSIYCISCADIIKNQPNTAYNTYTEDKKIELRAKALTRYYVSNKKVLLKPCEVCGSSKVVIYLADFNKPKEVRWFCKEHLVTKNISS